MAIYKKIFLQVDHHAYIISTILQKALFHQIIRSTGRIIDDEQSRYRIGEWETPLIYGCGIVYGAVFVTTPMNYDARIDGTSNM